MFNRYIPLFIIVGVLLMVYSFVLMFTGDWENGIGYFFSGIVSVLVCRLLLKIGKWWRD